MANQAKTNPLKLRKKSVSSRMNGQNEGVNPSGRFTTQELTQTIIATY